jgi:hypothetical protein
VKAGQLARGCIVASGKSSNTNRPSRHYGQCDIDAFAVHCPAFGSVYWVPVGEVTGASIQLRLQEPANSQQAKIKFASDYYIGQV